MRQAVVMLAVFIAFAANAQQKPADVSGVAAQAGIIFRGRVIAIELKSARSPDEITQTLVTFRVEDAVRGVANGQLLTIGEWNAIADEYRNGESVILFLYAPSARLGLTSPVGGRAGHRRVDEVPAVVLDGLRTANATPSSPPPTQDIERQDGPAVIAPARPQEPASHPRRSGRHGPRAPETAQ